MTATEARERVTRGAALLDQKRPGWAGRIDIATLRISSCQACVVGQLFGVAERFAPFTHGIEALGIYGSQEDYGFALAGPFNAEKTRRWQFLQDAWIEAIADRLVTGDGTLPSGDIQEAQSVERAL